MHRFVFLLIAKKKNPPLDLSERFLFRFRALVAHTIRVTTGTRDFVTYTPKVKVL